LEPRANQPSGDTFGGLVQINEQPGDYVSRRASDPSDQTASKRLHRAAPAHSGGSHGCHHTRAHVCPRVPCVPYIPCCTHVHTRQLHHDIFTRAEERHDIAKRRQEYGDWRRRMSAPFFFLFSFLFFVQLRGSATCTEQLRVAKTLNSALLYIPLFNFNSPILLYIHRFSTAPFHRSRSCWTELPRTLLDYRLLRSELAYFVILHPLMVLSTFAH
jgi:hypothetical protein